VHVDTPYRFRHQALGGILPGSISRPVCVVKPGESLFSTWREEYLQTRSQPFRSLAVA